MFQELSIDIKNAPRQGDLTPQIIFWVFESPGGLQVSTFGSGSCILPLCPKWGRDNDDLADTMVVWTYVDQVLTIHKIQQVDQTMVL